MTTILFFFVYFVFTILGMVCARTVFSKTISLENKKERIKAVVIRALIISTVLSLPFLDIEENTKTIQEFRYRLMGVSIVIGFMVQWERSKAKIQEYKKLDEDETSIE